MPDTAPSIEARYSSSRLWRVAGGVAVVALVCAFLGFSPYTSSQPEFKLAKVQMGAAFCGVLLIYLVYLAIAKSGKVAFTVGPDGVLDTRVSEQIIPWSAIEAVSTWRDPSLPEKADPDERAVLLKLKAGEIARLNMTGIARLARAADRNVTGFDGFQIRTGGTDVDHGRLLEVMESYLASAPPEPPTRDARPQVPR
jgi:hypothetical protein